MAFLNCNRDSLSALKEVDLKVGRRGGVRERERARERERERESERGCLPKPDTAQIVSPHTKLSGNTLSLSHHQSYSFLLSSQAFVTDVPGQNPQLLLIRVLVHWAQTMKLLKSARGGEKEKERETRKLWRFEAHHVWVCLVWNDLPAQT